MPASVRARFHHQPMRSGLTSSGPRPNIHGPYGSRSARSASIGGDGVGVERDACGCWRSSSAASRRSGVPLASAGDLDRRVDRQHPVAQVGPLQRGQLGAAGAGHRGDAQHRARRPDRSSAAAAITARTSSSVITVRRWRLRRPQPSEARHVGADPAPPDRLRQRRPQHAVLVLDAGVAHARCGACGCATARRRRPTDGRRGRRAIWSFLMPGRGSAGRGPTTAPTCRGSARPTRRARRSTERPADDDRPGRPPSRRRRAARRACRRGRSWTAGSAGRWRPCR